MFNLAKEADEAVEVLRTSTKKPRRDSANSQDGNRENDPELDILVIIINKGYRHTVPFIILWHCCMHFRTGVGRVH